ncbi:hypothetical protein GGF32_006691 [Allomyces javanicus]|nr:hypothetical protein GGF32_006691 [Allomyces javanicus]
MARIRTRDVARIVAKPKGTAANEDCSKVGIDAFDPAFFFTSVIFTVTLFLAALVPVVHSLWRRWTHRDTDRVRSTSWLHLIVMLLFIPACLPRALSFILDPFAGRQTLVSSQVSRVLFMSYFTIVLSQYSLFLMLWFEFTAHIRVMVPHLLSPDRRLREPPDISTLVKTIRIVFAAVNIALYGFEVAMVLLGATTMLQTKYMTPIYAGFFVVMSVALVVGLVFASYRLNVGRHHRHNLSEMHPDPDVARLVAVQAAATRRAVLVSAFIVLNTFLRMVVVFDVLRDPNVWLGYQDFLRFMEVTSGLVLWYALTSIQWNALEPVYADLNATAIRASPASSPTTRHRTSSQERRTAALRALGLPKLFTSAALASSSANDPPRRRSAFALRRTPSTPPPTPTAAAPAAPARTDAAAHAAGIVFVNDRRRPGLYTDRQPAASTFELNFKMIHGHSIGSTPVDHVELEEVASKPVAPAAAAAPDVPRWPDPDDSYWRGAAGGARQDSRTRGARAGQEPEPRPLARAARVVTARPPDVDHDWDDEWSVIDNGRAPVAW